MPAPSEPRWEYRWFLRRVLPQYHGKLCRILTAGDQGVTLPATPNIFMPGAQHPRSAGGSGTWGQWRGQIVVEFQDGVRVTTTRVSIKRLRSARGAWGR